MVDKHTAPVRRAASMQAWNTPRTKASEGTQTDGKRIANDIRVVAESASAVYSIQFDRAERTFDTAVLKSTPRDALMQGHRRKSVSLLPFFAEGDSARLMTGNKADAERRRQRLGGFVSARRFSRASFSFMPSKTDEKEGCGNGARIKMKRSKSEHANDTKPTPRKGIQKVTSDVKLESTVMRKPGVPNSKLTIRNLDKQSPLALLTLPVGEGAENCDILSDKEGAKTSDGCYGLPPLHPSSPQLQNDIVTTRKPHSLPPLRLKVHMQSEFSPGSTGRSIDLDKMKADQELLGNKKISEIGSPASRQTPLAKTEAADAQKLIQIEHRSSKIICLDLKTDKTHKGKEIIFEDVLAEGRTGDLLLFKTKGCHNECVRCCVSMRYNHVAVLVKNPNEALGVCETLVSTGVAIFRFSDFYIHKWHEQYEEIVYRKLDIPRSSKVKKSFHKEVSDYLNLVVQRPYRWTPMMFCRCCLSESTMEVDRKKKAFFCSELVGAILKAGGLIPEEEPSVVCGPKAFENNGMIDDILRTGASYGPELRIIFPE
ncbi:hypothetical protein AAMO2058_000048800 [Amorphochlora amoebiformis]